MIPIYNEVSCGIAVTYEVRNMLTYITVMKYITHASKR